MPETKLFVEETDSISQKCEISPSVAQELNISEGDMIRLSDPDNPTTFTSCRVSITENVLDFSIKVASDILSAMNYDGIEFRVAPSSEPAGVRASEPISQPTQMPGTQQPSISPPPQMPGTQQPSMPQPGQMLGTQPSSSVPPPSSAGGFNSYNQQSGSIPPPPSMGTQPPSMGMEQPSMGMEQPSMRMEQAPPPDPYPNRVDPNILATQKDGGMVLTVKKVPFADGRVKLNNQAVQELGLTQGMILAWEDPLTRSEGSARITVDNSVPRNSITIGVDTVEDTNLKADQIVVYSTEPPIVHQDQISLEIVSQADLNGIIMVNPRNAASLGVQEGDVLAFEDYLTGAVGAAKFKIKEDLPNNQVVIDSELLEASGIGSMEVDLKKNMRQIIPLQSVELGIAPIKGEDVWSVISMARQNINSIKSWLANYIIFKGIKLRWQAANVACEFLSTVPDLMGDVFAEITPNTTLTLKPTGLVTFNAILIIDISRSMMGRDVEVKNIGPALEGIKAAMKAKKIQEFLKKFKPGIMVPRRYSAAFGAILFLSEKVGRGFGEKVSIIRFADQAQALQFGDGKMFMDSSSGEKDVLEDAAKLIVDEIGNAYGQATNMGQAMLKAQELLYAFGDDMPTMIVLLTDGVATDGDQFFKAVQAFSANPNVVMYIIGLGNPDDQAMKRAAALCGGEYFKPNDSGELLIWYSKRARDLQVKLKGNRT
ncbi:MAG: VWA domain-containing protein [Candidatus Lokiarchaeota archaeon]|nr:VWA domain-containing protein [Candidatus Lokiarchaeota archaeon]